MSNSNIFKIKILQPSFFQDYNTPTSSRRQTPKIPRKNLVTQLNSAPKYQPEQIISRFKMPPGATLTVEHSKKSLFRGKSDSDNEPIQSHKSVSCRTNQTRKTIRCDSVELKKEDKPQIPQSAMLKKSRKRSWQNYNSKIPIISQADIIFKKDQQINEQKQEYMGFLKTKCIFVRIVKYNDNLECQPISNQYIAKCYGRLHIQNLLYFVVQNFSNNSIRDVIDNFGPTKQSLGKRQIRNLVEGIIHCHSRGVIHNRINPDTIFMNPQGNLLIDFFKVNKRHPSENQKMKYFHYFSPEILAYGHTIEACDVWAIGCLTLEILTGKIKTSSLHPYNEHCQASPQLNNEALQKVKQIREGYGNPFRKQHQHCNINLCQNAELSLSKQARSFIKACLKTNQRTRPQLSMLIDHQFLRVNQYF